MGGKRDSQTASGRTPGYVPKQAPGGQPLEDRALKAAAQFMGEELLPFLGIEGTMKRIAPTEQVYLNIKDLMEDFNYEMMDGSWRHLEFESDEITKEDLRRFRAYEAIISFYHKVEVTTCVVCSSRVRKVRQELKEGLCTYRVQVVRLKKYNADKLIGEMEEKQKAERLGREDLIKILLTPLMDGRMPQPERIVRGLRLVKCERDSLEQEDILRMQAVIYTLAMKFLRESELETVKEEIKMSLLGEMIRNDGIKEGIEIGMERGREEGISALIETCREFNAPEEEIINRLMEKFGLTRETAEASCRRHTKEK